MKIISLDSETRKISSLKELTSADKIKIVKFTSERLDTFPHFIDFIWNFPDGSTASSGQSPEVFVTPYHRQPVAEVWEDKPLILENVRFLKFALNTNGQTREGERSNCKIYFEEL